MINKMTMEMIIEIILEIILELTSDQAEIGDQDGRPLTVGGLGARFQFNGMVPYLPFQQCIKGLL